MLSCYTANLHGYLARDWDADAIIARSVRLAVRTDLPAGQLAFSHHDPPLDLLPDGSVLRYEAAECGAFAQPHVEDELRAAGRVLVLVDHAKLPWSLTRGYGPTPHWLLVDGRSAGSWHVIDEFSAQLPQGEQRPFRGWIGADELAHAMALPTRWQPEHAMRNALAFGAPAPLPAGGALWLRRHEAGSPVSRDLEGDWLTSDDEVLPFLASYVIECGADAARHLDDVWAAAVHRSYSYRWRIRNEATAQPGALAVAAACWDALPQRLRFVAESALRGRPRPTLVRATMEALLCAQRDLR